MEASGLRVRRMDSRSHLDLGRRPGAKGLIRRGVQAALNGTTWILNSGVHGVILRAYASRAAAGDSVRSTAPGGA